MTTVLKPSATAKLVYENAEIKIYADGTWVPLKAGWKIHEDARVYAASSGAASIKAKTGRYKLSHMTGPSGTVYDVWGIATGVVKAP